MAQVEDDEYRNAGGEANYYSIAHTIKEEVKCQPAMLVNGQLKEYQVKVSALTLMACLLISYQDLNLYSLKLLIYIICVCWFVSIADFTSICVIICVVYLLLLVII